MAADELLSFHERLTPLMQNIIKCETYGVFAYSWVIVAIPFVILVAIFFARFLWNLPKRTTIIFLVSGIVYLGGCIGFEMLGGWQAEKHGVRNLTYFFLVTFEESLEMFGVIIFIHGLLDYMRTYCQNEIRDFLKL